MEIKLGKNMYDDTIPSINPSIVANVYHDIDAKIEDDLWRNIRFNINANIGINIKGNIWENSCTNNLLFLSEQQIITIKKNIKEQIYGN